MNNNIASELITGSLIGNDFKTVILNAKAYTIKPPSIKIICRAVYYFSKIDFEDKEQTALSVIGQIPKNANHITKGLSYLIAGESKLWKWKAYFIERELKSATPEELYGALIAATNLMGANDFFQCAVLLKSVANQTARSK